ncbi:MAG TPA: thioredoxin domain-containing protein, partial [Usitatibacter sp.]|nr:thioredoxin domain-containing protein [Usitatibacter sp.]
QLDPPRTVIVRGARDAFGPWRELLERSHLPSTLSLYIPAGLSALPPVLDKPATDRVNAWVCEGVTCLVPIDKPDQLRAALKLPKIPAPQ